MTDNETLLSVGGAAKLIGHGISAKDISVLFYGGALRDDLCPVVAGRRLIPLNYVATIAAALRRRGKLPQVSQIGDGGHLG
jgi:hypothetical protein